MDPGKDGDPHLSRPAFEVWFGHHDVRLAFFDHDLDDEILVSGVDDEPVDRLHVLHVFCEWQFDRSRAGGVVAFAYKRHRFVGGNASGFLKGRPTLVMGLERTFVLLGPREPRVAV